MRWRSVAAMTLVLAPLLAISAGAADPAGAGGLVRPVATATELRDALGEADGDDTGPHRIVLTADIDIGSEPLHYTGSPALAIVGHGHTLSGSGPALLRSLSDATLSVWGLTVTGTASGIHTRGSAIVANSAFLRIGVGHRLADAGAALNVGRSLPGSSLRVVDSTFRGNRAFNAGLVQARRAQFVRTRFLDNVTTYGVVVAFRARLQGSTVLRTRTPNSGVLEAEAFDLELVDSLVAGTRVGNGTGSAPAPTLSARRGTVMLRRAVIRDNGFRGTGALAAAIRALNLRADHAIVRHGTRACWIRDRSVWITSLASDRSCRFP